MSFSPGGASADSGDGGPNPYGDADGPQSSKSPLSGFSFLKSLTGDKKTRDGQPAKRRGPKPDSKPALTRRQELNRQAQRTHRERKEMYIKALEQEVIRLKEVYTGALKDRDVAIEENRKLRELLNFHGIAYDHQSPGSARLNESNFGASSTGSVSGSYGPQSTSSGFTSPPNTIATSIPQQQQQQHQPQSQSTNALNYDQIGIDFVLTLEQPCMDHAQLLMVKSQEGEVDFSGHVLMATCPTESHLIERPDVPYHEKMMPDMGMPDLLKLLDLSNRLPLDGEITPVMAWAYILKHPRFPELNPKDFTTLKNDLLAKVRCYGFGAVLEEFEVRDALSSVFATKIESYNMYG